MQVKYQLRYMTGLIYLILASGETNKFLRITWAILAGVEIFASHWYNYKSKKDNDK